MRSTAESLRKSYTLDTAGLEEQIKSGGSSLRGEVG